MRSTTVSRLATVSAVLLAACLLAPAVSAASTTYMIQQSDLLDCGSSCAANSYYNGCGSAQPGFHWTDTLPAGSNVTSVTIELNHGVDCGGGNFDGALNGQAAGSWSGVFWCNCAARDQLFTLNAPAAAYVVGANNEFRMTNPVSCQGYAANFGALSGAYARITVEYDGGGAAVPAASTTSIVATIVLLLGASLIFVGRKAA